MSDNIDKRHIVNVSETDASYVVEFAKHNEPEVEESSYMKTIKVMTRKSHTMMKGILRLYLRLRDQKTNTYSQQTFQKMRSLGFIKIKP